MISGLCLLLSFLLLYFAVPLGACKDANNQPIIQAYVRNRSKPTKGREQSLASDYCYDSPLVEKEILSDA